MQSGMPAISVQGFADAGLPPQQLLALLEEGWSPDAIMGRDAGSLNNFSVDSHMYNIHS